MEGGSWCGGDGGGGRGTGPLTVSTPTQAPESCPLSGRGLNGASIDIPVLQAASDPDGDPLTVISVNHTGPIPTSVVSLNSDGTVHYQSVHGWFGQDYFEYTVSDGHGGTSTGTVSVYVFEGPHF